MPLTEVEWLDIKDYRYGLEMAINLMFGQSGMGGFETECTEDKARKTINEFNLFRKQGLI